MTLVVLSADRRQKVDEEAKDVEEVDETYSPLQHGRSIPLILLRADGKRNGKRDLEDDEGELDPEGVAQDGLLAEVDAQALVLRTYEDCAHDVAYDKDPKENVMQLVVVFVVEDGEQDEARGAGDGRDDGEG